MKEFSELESLPLDDGLELPILTQDVLDDVWKQTEFNKPYSEARMQHLLETCGVCLDLTFSFDAFTHFDFLAFDFYCSLTLC